MKLPVKYVPLYYLLQLVLQIPVELVSRSMWDNDRAFYFSEISGSFINIYMMPLLPFLDPEDWNPYTWSPWLSFFLSIALFLTAYLIITYVYIKMNEATILLNSRFAITFLFNFARYVFLLYLFIPVAAFFYFFFSTSNPNTSVAFLVVFYAAVGGYYYSTWRISNNEQATHEVEVIEEVEQWSALPLKFVPIYSIAHFALFIPSILLRSEIIEIEFISFADVVWTSFNWMIISTIWIFYLFRPDLGIEWISIIILGYMVHLVGYLLASYIYNWSVHRSRLTIATFKQGRYWLHFLRYLLMVVIFSFVAGIFILLIVLIVK